MCPSIRRSVEVHALNISNNTITFFFDTDSTQMISLHHLKQNFLFSLKNLSCSWSPINQDLSWLGHHIIQENRFSLKVYSNNMHGFGFFQQFLVSCSSNGTQLYQLTQFLIHFYKKISVCTYERTTIHKNPYCLQLNIFNSLLCPLLLFSTHLHCVSKKTIQYELFIRELASAYYM